MPRAGYRYCLHHHSTRRTRCAAAAAACAMVVQVQTAAGKSFLDLLDPPIATLLVAYMQTVRAHSGAHSGGCVHANGPLYASVHTARPARRGPACPIQPWLCPDTRQAVDRRTTCYQSRSAFLPPRTIRIVMQTRIADATDSPVTVVTGHRAIRATGRPHPDARCTLGRGLALSERLHPPLDLSTLSSHQV